MNKKGILNNFMNTIYELLALLNKNKNEYLKELIKINEFYIDEKKSLENLISSILSLIDKIKVSKYNKLENSKFSCENINDKIINKINYYIDEVNGINEDITNNYDNIINMMDFEPFSTIINNYNKKLNDYKEEINNILKTPKMIKENSFNINNDNISKFIGSLNTNINKFLDKEELNLNKNKFTQTEIIINNSFFSNKTKNIEDPLKLEANNLIKSIDKLIKNDNNINYNKTYENNNNKHEHLNIYENQKIPKKKLNEKKINKFYISEKLLNLKKNNKNSITNKYLNNSNKVQKSLKSTDYKKKEKKTVYKDILKNKKYKK